MTDRKPLICGQLEDAPQPPRGDPDRAEAVVPPRRRRTTRRRRVGASAVHRSAFGADRRSRATRCRSRSAPRTAIGRSRARSPARSSPPMLAKLNVAYVIVGHSERRELFGETDEMVNAKVRAVLELGMTPICVCGETLDEREAGRHRREGVRPGPRRARPGLTREQVGALVVAYEPIWAIGTGRTATPTTPSRSARSCGPPVAEIVGAEPAASVRDPVRRHRSSRRTPPS